MWAVAAIGIGTAINIYGQWRANNAQAAAEAQNAAFLREQAKLAQIAGEREELIAERDSKRLFGAQVSAYASAGVDITSGSALTVLAESRALALEEKAAIRTETSFRVRLASLRAAQSDATAKQLRDPTNNLLQAVGTGAMGAGTAASFAKSGNTSGGNKGMSSKAANNGWIPRGAGTANRGALGDSPSEY